MLPRWLLVPFIINIAAADDGGFVSAMKSLLFGTEQHNTSNNAHLEMHPSPSASGSPVFHQFAVAQQQASGQACMMPQQIGTGPYRIPRWYFNPARGRCELFYWSGCCGNGNNFQTFQSCQSACEESPNPCAVTVSIPGGQCTPGVSSCGGGSFCHVGANAQTTTCCPKPAPIDRCQQPLNVGIGNAQLQRWYFNPLTQQCQPCIYRGLQGNENNFLSKQDCENSCLGNNPCAEPWTKGEGNSALTRFYYDAVQRKCLAFNYLGLKGNQNNFLTKEACEALCPVWVNPCAVGQPILTPDQRPFHCNQNAPCSSGFRLSTKQALAVVKLEVTLTTCSKDLLCPDKHWCHIGETKETTVCCPSVLPDPCMAPARNPGEGTYHATRWAFDGATRKCVPFEYRGLRGNANNFISRETCERQCPGGDPCSQPMDRGVGMAQLQRWYWNGQSQTCVQFSYCGMKGTQNNFLSKQDCERTCYVLDNPCALGPPQMGLDNRPITCSVGMNTCGASFWCHFGANQQTTVCCPGRVEGQAVCRQPLALGTGEAALPRWYYDASTMRCVQFFYKGRYGNQNNFLSQHDCEQTCPVFVNPCNKPISLPPQLCNPGGPDMCGPNAWCHACDERCGPNPCFEGRPFVGVDGRPQTCSISANLNTCPANYWCHIGVDMSTTVCCPGASINVCNLPMSTGEGNYNLERYYFDQSTKTCRPFIYNGLKGNQNNFITLRACQLSCQPLDNPCIGQPATTAAGQVLFCSSTNKDTCPVNFWCHLGATPETTVCCPGATNPCSVPLAPGTGNAGLARWYYNPDDRQCFPFQYNGKRGNQNNFETQAECERTCPEELCLLSIDRGACGGRQTRYAFNRQTSQCVPFDYTGCGGNLNNFVSMMDCMATCGNVGFRR
nr:Proteinase inhibitor I2 domain containing protein [Haemonchus contortus]